MALRVLVVDDALFMRNMLKDIFVHAGFEVVAEADNGEMALGLYQETRPDLVTMDITMRGMDGFEAARRILHEDGQARIIFLSNLDEAQYSQEAEKIGARGYLNKHRSKDILALIAAL